MKTNPSTAKNDVFNYGTTTLATPVYTKDGVAATALAADPNARPGEYDFLSIDLNKTGSLSYSGQTLYSVVARPSGDLDFSNAKVIVDSTDISDPNTKQLVRASTGGSGSITDNLYFAGGTVAFELYTTDVSGDASNQYLSILNLPEGITNLVETVTTFPTYATATKLVARFNVYYTDLTGVDVLVWDAVPAFKTATGKWVIHITNDQYNTARSKEFGGSVGTEIDLSGITLLLTVSVNLAEDNVYVRRFNNLPVKITAGVNKEQIAIHAHVTAAGERIVGIGDFSYTTLANTPIYNLQVKGSLGVQISYAARTTLLVNNVSGKFGFDLEDATETASYISFTTSGCNLYSSAAFNIYNINNLGDASRSVTLDASYSTFGYDLDTINSSFVAGPSDTYINHQGVAKLYMSASIVFLSNNISGTTNISLSSDTIQLTADHSGSAATGLYITSTFVRVGYDTNLANYIQFSATQTRFYQSDDRLSYDGTDTRIGYIVSGGSAGNYVVFTSTSTTFNFTAASTRISYDVTDTRIGYLTGTTNYAVFAAASVSFYFSTTTRLFYDTTTTLIAGPTAASPRITVTESATTLGGTATYANDTNFLYLPVSGGPIIINGGNSFFGLIINNYREIAASKYGRIVLSSYPDPTTGLGLGAGDVIYDRNETYPVLKVPYATGATWTGYTSTAPIVGSGCLVMGDSGGQIFLAGFVTGIGWRYVYLTGTP